MELQQLVAQLRAIIEGAKSMPMSSSAVVNRSSVLSLVSQIESVTPAVGTGTGQAAETAGEQAGPVAAKEAQDILAQARKQQSKLVSDSEVYRVAQHEATKIMAVAQRESDELRKETDDYLDERLAGLEVALTKTLEAVTRGRERLSGSSRFAELQDLEDGSRQSDGSPDDLSDLREDAASASSRLGTEPGDRSIGEEISAASPIHHHRG